MVGLALTLLAVHALAQDAQKRTFPLNHEFVAQVTGCNDLDAAKVVVDSHATDGIEVATKVFLMFRQVGVCGSTEAPVKYLSLKHTATLKDGVKLHIYEGEIGGTTTYFITDWNHSSERPKPKGQVGV